MPWEKENIRSTEGRWEAQNAEDIKPFLQSLPQLRSNSVTLSVTSWFTSYFRTAWIIEKPLNGYKRSKP